MNSFFIRGSSSLLFLISIAKAFYCSKLIAWKISNVILIVVSFLCNANRYQPPYLLIDYAAIFAACTSYLNNAYLNVPLYLSIIYEYNQTGSIEITKNVAFVSTVAKCMINTYLYVDKAHFYVLLTCSVTGAIVYKIRYTLHAMNDTRYIILLTYLFHICIMNVLYTASITAV